MNETITIRNTLIFILLFASHWMFAQTENQRADIVRDYDIEYLNQLSTQFSDYYQQEKRKALDYALANNIETIIPNENGGIAILEQVLDDGTLLYVTTYNDSSAVTINTNNVHIGGNRNLDLDGTGIVMGVWDGGIVRLSHQELVGRVQQLDNPNGLSSHATHVTGTMIASGVNPSAKGMSYNGSVLAYDFGNDTSEMATEAASGLLISNHSYGLVPGQLPDNFFGAYLNSTRNIDQITYNAPYYLPVFAAGNSRNNGPSSGGPHNPTKNGYDLLSGKNLAKNVLCVANVIGVANYTGPNSVNVWSTSSFGPTDDGRIKPDISAQGRNTFSSTAGSDDSYASFTGTSMAAPAVSGSLGLLQEHHNNMYGSFLTAATMRALVIHTAREAGGFPGPDYAYGWGLMNTAAAADMITFKGFTSLVEENTLSDGDTYTFTVEALDTSVPLVATIAWTDPAGTVQNTSTPDDPTPRLVNDLDIRVTDQNGTVTFPWRLNPLIPGSAATRADNIVDNVEKIEIENPSGTYTIEVSHKGSLVDLEQDYSLVVSGIEESELSIVSNKTNETFCGNETAVFSLNVFSVPGFSGNITLSQTGLPASLTPSFIPFSVIDEGPATLFISDLDTVSGGDYPFSVTATSGTSTASFDLLLTIEGAGNLPNLTILGPGAGTTDLNPVLEWDPEPNADSYEVEISTDSNFSVITETAQTTSTQYQTQELDPNTNYFWRVRPLNNCVTGTFVSSSFATSDFTCAPLFTATDTPVAIPDDGVATVQSMVTVPDTFLGFEIEDVNVHLEIAHTWFEDLTVLLTSPGGTTITLIEEQCGQFNDALVIIDDKGVEPVCSSTPPTLSGTIKGVESLAAFKDEFFNGDWVLTVEDNFGEDGGSIENFELEICYDDLLSTTSVALSEFKLYPNPSSEMVNIILPQSISRLNKIEIFDISGRLIDTKENIVDVSNVQFNVSAFNTGVYLVRLNTEKGAFTKKLIVR
mgnify:CR=1 FL=1